MSIKTVTNEYLLNLVETYKLTAAAADYARETLLTEPSREVGQHARNNVAGAFCSPSQGITIQYESHTAELAKILRWELDPNVVGYRDQPPMVRIRKADKNGVLRNTTYTPDFVLFFSNDIRVVEVKTESKLRQLADKYPEQWECIAGTWIYLPAEKAFREKGLSHWVCSVDTTQSIETNNLKTLLQASRMTDAVLPRVSKKLLDALDVSAWLSLSNLQAQVPQSSYADIYLMILNKQIFTNLKTQVLTDKESCFVASDPSLLSVRDELTEQAPDVIGSVKTSVVPGKAELERALARLERINSGEQSRHVRRLRKQVVQCDALGKTPLQALIMPRKGNTNHKITEKVRACAREHIQSYYMSSENPKVHAAWTKYKNWSRDKHPDFDPVSLTTYKKFIALESSEAVAYSRGGRRAGNAAAATTSVLDRALTATRPLERCSVDHTKLKFFVKVCESNGLEYVRKPWLSALIDDYSGYLLTFFLTFQDPSKRSVSMLFRNVAREHGRLPEHVHSDRGSDFGSVYYRALAGHYGITSDRSPAGHSRYNSGVEQLNKQLVSAGVKARLSAAELFRAGGGRMATLLHLSD